MRQLPILKPLLAIMCLLFSFNLQALDATADTIHVEKAGTLATLISPTDKYSINDLTLSGNLNGVDISYIKEMAGRSGSGDTTEGKLTKLNMADANIVKGSGYNTYQTIDNAISHYMFTFLTNLTSIILPNSVTSIDECAFKGCSGLVSITIPKNVKSIGKSAFSECLGLNSITISNNVTSIDEYAFSGCSELTSVTIPNSVTFIGSGAFWNCAKLNSITIPKGVTFIGNAAFGYCKGITSVTISSSVTSISGAAFISCSSLKEIVVSKENLIYSDIEGVLFNKDYTQLVAYPNAKSTTYIIPKSVTSIGNEAFRDCKSLTTVTIPENVVSIGWNTFGDCKGLTKIYSNNRLPPKTVDVTFNGVNMTTCKLYVPNSSYSAYWIAFGWGDFMNIIDEVTTPITGEIPPTTINVTTAGTLPYLIAESKKYMITDLTLTGNLNGSDIGCIRAMAGYENGTFGELSKLDLSDANIVKGGDFSAHDDLCYSNEDNVIPMFMFYKLSNLTSIILPKSITSVKEYAFQECTGLTSITIPDKISSIGAFAFSGCSGLKEILASKENPNYTDLEGVLFSKDKTQIVAYPNAKSSTYSIPNNVTSIGVSAFSDCKGISSVKIPNSITRIEDKAFYGCTGLMTVTIPNSVDFIGDSAFRNSGLTSIIIPNSVDSIKAGCFYNCTRLRSVTIPNSVISINQLAFNHCTNLTSIIIPNSVISIERSAFAYSGLTSIIIPNSVSLIDEDAFSSCTGLSSVTIPNNVSIISSGMFAGCTGLTSITLGNSVSSIESNAFGDCTGLKEIHCKSLTPSKVDSYSFDINMTTCILYVPIGTIETYENANLWKYFRNIIEEESTSIIQTKASNIKIYREKDAIVVTGAKFGEIISVYTESGSLLQRIKATDDEIRINIPTNKIYLIKTTGKTFKIAL